MNSNTYSTSFIDQMRSIIREELAENNAALGKQSMTAALGLHKASRVAEERLESITENIYKEIAAEGKLEECLTHIRALEEVGYDPKDLKKIEKEIHKELYETIKSSVRQGDDGVDRFMMTIGQDGSRSLRTDGKRYLDENFDPIDEKWNSFSDKRKREISGSYNEVLNTYYTNALHLQNEYYKNYAQSHSADQNVSSNEEEAQPNTEVQEQQTEQQTEQGQQIENTESSQ